jgi:hypothetical protein
MLQVPQSILFEDMPAQADKSAVSGEAGDLSATPEHPIASSAAIDRVKTK